MPQELVVEAPRRIGYAAYAEREPVGSEVLVRTRVSGIKHGAELNMYRGTLPFAEELFDREARLFRPPREDEKIAPFYPHPVGSWAAGVVEAVGPDARRSSMPVWDCDNRCAPMWDLRRLERTAVALLAGQALRARPLIGARIPFARAAEAYELIDTAPAGHIKVLLTYPE